MEPSKDGNEVLALTMLDGTIRVFRWRDSQQWERLCMFVNMGLAKRVQATVLEELKETL